MRPRAFAPNSYRVDYYNGRVPYHPYRTPTNLDGPFCSFREVHDRHKPKEEWRDGLYTRCGKIELFEGFHHFQDEKGRWKTLELTQGFNLRHEGKSDGTVWFGYNMLDWIFCGLTDTDRRFFKPGHWEVWQELSGQTGRAIYPTNKILSFSISEKGELNDLQQYRILQGRRHHLERTVRDLPIRDRGPRIHPQDSVYLRLSRL